MAKSRQKTRRKKASRQRQTHARRSGSMSSMREGFRGLTGTSPRAKRASDRGWLFIKVLILVVIIIIIVWGMTR